MNSLSRTQTGKLPAAARAAFHALVFFAATACALAQTGTAVVRHAPQLSGRIDGSVQLLTADNLFLHGQKTVVTGDILMPGTPRIVQHGRVRYEGTLDGSGAAEPSKHTIVLGSGVSLRHVVRRTDPVAMPGVEAPPRPAGTRKVVLRFPGQTPGDFATLCDLSVHRDLGDIVVPPGTYGHFSASDDSSFVLGVAGSTTPVVYNFQKLTLNGGSQLRVVGPVIVNVAGGLVLNRDHDRRNWRHDRRERFCMDAGDNYDVAVGSAQNPGWLVLNLHAGGLSLNRDDSFHGYVNAPAGTVLLDDHCTLVGGVVAARLKVQERSRLVLLEKSSKPPAPVNLPPSVTLQIADSTGTAATNAAVVLRAEASDADGSVARVEFYQGDVLLGSDLIAPYEFTWVGAAAGSYTLTAKATDDLGASTVSAPVVFAVNKSPADVSLGGLSAAYNGTPRSVTVGTLPAGLNVVVTYDGSTTPPVNAGSYMVVTTVEDANYTGSATGTLVVSQIAPVVTWAAPSDIFYGTALGAAQLNASANVPGAFTYTPSAGTVLNVGAGQILTATFTPADTVNYTPASASTAINVTEFVKVPATVTLAGLSAVYDGSAKPVLVTTSPAGLNVVVTYNGSATPPSAAGNYTVQAAVNDPNYTGSATATLAIAKATPVLAWAAPADISYGTALGVAQLNATASVPGTFAYTPAVGTVLNAGTARTLSAVFTPADQANYNSGSVSTPLNVNKALATVTLGNLSGTYDGSAKSVSAVTTPAGLNVVVTYNGSIAAPSSAGSYAVLATIDDANYIGTATGTLAIAKATPALAWAAPADISYGTALGAAQLNATASVPGTFAYTPGVGAVLNAGTAQTLSAVFTPDDQANYNNGSVSTSLNVNKALATVTLGNLSGNYDASVKSVSTVTVPAGLNVVVTYNGSIAAPSNAGSYAVLATIDDVNYIGTATGTLAIARATPVITWAAPADITAGTALSGAQLNATANTPGSFNYTPAAGAILPAGSNQLLTALFTPADATNYNTASRTNTINVLAATGGPLTIIQQPQSMTISPYDTATLSVVVTGAGPITYVWYANGEMLSMGSSNSITVSGFFEGQVTQYYVAVYNSSEYLESSTATVTCVLPPTPPTIVEQPRTQLAGIDIQTALQVRVQGSSPMTFQWQKDGADIIGANSEILDLFGVQPSDAGTYRVVVTNAYGSVTSEPAILKVASLAEPSLSFDLTGFAALGGTTGGGVIAETATTYRKVYNALDLASALVDARTGGAVRVIEIMNDLDLGWNELPASVKALAGTPFRSHVAPKLHPVLLSTGVSIIDVEPAPGLTIFSATGATIRHASLNIRNTSNLVIRNLRFDELWEWDEQTRGDYTANGWDFITLGDGGAVTNVWIDHCTFTKSYDGIIDMKAGVQNVTVSWCHVAGDVLSADGVSFVGRQLDVLEANPTLYPLYGFLRANGFSRDDIQQIVQGQGRGSLMGDASLSAENATLSATFHHLWLQNVSDRAIPRLRGGQVHLYNLWYDGYTNGQNKILRDQRVAEMSADSRSQLAGTYNFDLPLNGAISTEGGALLDEKSLFIGCVKPLRNNLTDITDPRYTGKIVSLDTIAMYFAPDSSSSTQRGDSTSSGSLMGPFDAPVVPFSWNTPAGDRPYPALIVHDPARVNFILPQAAGSGVMAWSKEAWLRTSY